MRPPRLVAHLLALALGSHPVGRSVLGDLAEEHADRARVSRTAAAWWYCREAAGVLLRIRSIARRRRPVAGIAAPVGDPLMQLLAHDLREATRTLRKEPRFLLITSLTLALGIAAATSIFSVVNGVLLRPLPYPNADRLVNLWSTAPGLDYPQFPLSPDLFLFFKKHNSVFEDMALFQNRNVNVTESGSPEVISASVATHSYFTTLGIAFSLGRGYGAQEDRPDGPSVAVISHRLWTRRYGADRALIGRAIRIDGTPTEVLGVAPRWLDQDGSPDVWLPARFDLANPPAGTFGWNATARLKPGVLPDQAVTHLLPLVKRAMEQVQTEHYRAFLRDGGYRPLVHPILEDLVGSLREPLWILLGTVVVVLLVACGNVANLCLVRADGRQREMAVRVALGASRGGLARKLLAEALVISAIGSVIGVALASAALPALLSVAPPPIPRLEQIRLDGVVVSFALAASLLSALLFGVAPALRYTRPDMLAALRQGGRSATDGKSQHRGRHLLVVAQTAAALVLLVGAGLLARSFARLTGAELGFKPRDVLTFRVALPPTTYAQPAALARFGQQLVDRLGEIPSIESAGAATAVPLAAGVGSGTAFEFADRPVEAGRLPPIIWYQTVTPGFFQTIGVSLQRGRDFNSTELGDGVHSVIVNQALARQYWPDGDPIGKQLRVADDEEPNRPWLTVVGVVATVRQNDLREPLTPQIYFPLGPGADNTPRALTYVVRGPNVIAQAEAMRRAVWAIDRDLPVAAVQTLQEAVDQSVVQFSFTLFTLGIAAFVALVLGAVGLYGVLSYAVSLRTREIGVRLALGAQTSRVMRSVVANGILIAGLGLVLGSAGAAALTRFLSGMLYEVEPLDVATFTLMPVVLLAVAAIASYLPARRAAAISPLEAMRAE
jgi:predicted permease